MGERDAIADSDQRRSFRVFWGFLMSSCRQGELSALLERVLSLEPVANSSPMRGCAAFIAIGWRPANTPNAPLLN